jgi:hypothetical protein
MEARVGLLGSAAFGLVIGWLCFLVARGTRGAFGVSARSLIFTAATFLGSAALAFFHVGSNGALTMSIGAGLGVLAGAAVFGIRPVASSIGQNGG